MLGGRLLAVTAVGVLVIAAAAAFAPLITVAAAVALTVILLVIRYAQAMLLVLVAALPWEGLLAFPSEQVTVVKLLGVLVMAAWLFRSFSTSELLISPHAGVPVIFLGLWVGISLVVSPDPAAGMVTALSFLLYIAFFFLAVQLLRDREGVLRAIRVAVVSTALAGVFALLGFFRGDSLRAGGPIEDPNEFAFVAATLLPLATFLVLQERSRRWLWVPCFLALMAATFATFSRGGLVGLAALLAWALATGRLPLRGLAMGLTAAVVVIATSFAFAGPLLEERLEVKGNATSANTTSRIEFWKAAVSMWADRPLTGVGPNRYSVESRSYVRSNPTDLVAPVTHNSYLHVLAESGLPALLAFLAFFVLSWRGLTTSERRAAARDDPRLRQLVLAMKGTFVVAIVSGSFISAQLTTPFWLIGALSAVLIAAGAPALPGSVRRPVAASSALGAVAPAR